MTHKCVILPLCTKKNVTNDQQMRQNDFLSHINALKHYCFWKKKNREQRNKYFVRGKFSFKEEERTATQIHRADKNKYKYLSQFTTYYIGISPHHNLYN